MANDLTSLSGLAQKLNLSREWLRAEADAGRIPFLKAGRRKLFNLEAVKRTLAIRAGESSSGPKIP